MTVLALNTDAMKLQTNDLGLSNIWIKKVINIFTAHFQICSSTICYPQSVPLWARALLPVL